MKNYSFSNIANQQSYAGRKSNDFTNYYRHSQLKSTQANQRIQEIKKKYDTPSRRQRIESLKKSKDYDMGSRGTYKQQGKENAYQHKMPPTFGNNYLKESISINRLDRSTLKDSESRQFGNSKLETRDHRKSYQCRQSQPLSLKNNNVKDEQEFIFSKMRQMKESLINNDYMKHSANLTKPTANANKNSYEDSKNSKKRQYDPRVENIDKINSKIKQILSCLSQNQKQQPSYTGYSKETFNKQPAFTTETKSKEGGKDSAFFGINNVNFKDISQSKKSYQSHFHKGSDVLQKIDVYDTKNTPYNNKQGAKYQRTQERLSKNENYSVSKSILDYQPPRTRDYSVNRVETYTKSYNEQKQADLIRTPVYANRQYSQIKGLKVSQSKSQIDSIKKSTLTANDSNNGILKSGKKLNDQINRIQRKIQEFEKEKKKLNIQFTPFSSKNNKSQSNLNTSIRQKKVSEYPQEIKTEAEQVRSSSLLKSNNANNRSSSYDLKLKNYMNRASMYQQKINQLKINTKLDRQSTSYNANKSINTYESKDHEKNEFQFKLQDISVKTVRIQNEVQQNEYNSFNQFSSNAFNQNTNDYQSSSNYSRVHQKRQSDVDEQGIRKRTDEGMQERKKRLQCSQNIIKTETLKKIVSLFCQQVKYDQNFRNLKIWLEACFNKDKYDKISMLLEKQGIEISNKQCEKLFSVDQSQNNPFFTTQGFDGSYDQLIKSYIDCQNHWINQICHKFDRKALTAQGFTSQRIDLQRKGYIQLQDLVRFLNIESGTFYRNRDLFLIFHRFTNTDKMNFQKIIEQISA